MKKNDLTKLINYSKLRFRISKTMRYDDVGDYLESSIIAYDMKNPIITNAIMLHEFIEYSLIRSAGIPVSMIDAFDTDDEAPEKHKREYRLYTKYHRIANNVERYFIENMGMSWKSYQKAVYSAKVKVKPMKKNSKVKQAKTRNIR